MGRRKKQPPGKTHKKKGARPSPSNFITSMHRKVDYYSDGNLASDPGHLSHASAPVDTLQG
jgi:hypothetical protein